MTDEELYLVLRQIALKATGVSMVILADTNQDAPTTDYCAIRPRAAVSERGQANITESYDATAQTITTTVRQQLIVSSDFDFYRGTAPQTAAKMKQANKLPSVSSMLSAAGIGWADTSSVMNLTAIQSNNMEQRAQITVRLFMEEVLTDTVNTIEKVSVSVQNEKGVVLQEIDVP
ncbi:MAG: hypothetical protein [Caudoviricetes sp.]|nr:MAG: hypothetical protein [Caudoviricetes sp.]